MTRMARLLSKVTVRLNRATTIKATTRIAAPLLTLRLRNISKVTMIPTSSMELHSSNMDTESSKAMALSSMVNLVRQVDQQKATAA